jgi:uncharacterized membrane protein
MTKQAFLQTLKQALGNEPEAHEIINYYDELIDEATLSGELESDVIQRLDSVDQIVRSLGKDPQAYKRKNTVVDKTVNLTVTLIGKIAIVFLCGVTALIGISFVSSAGISIFSSIYRLVGITDTMVILYFVSQLVFSVGLTLIGVWITIKMIGYIKQTIQEIDQLFNQKKGV